MDRYRVTREDGRSYLCTCAFSGWLPIFNFGRRYFEIIGDSLTHCRIKKGLVLHGYVLMVDHLHLIVRHDDLSEVMRAFKSWTSRLISNALEEENRVDALKIIRRAAFGRPGQELSVWQPGFHPKGIIGDAMMLQKLQYVHNNPVRKGFVAAPEGWLHSSARDYVIGKTGPIEIDRVSALCV